MYMLQFMELTVRPDLDTLGDVAGVYLGLAARLLGPLAPSDPHL